MDLAEAFRNHREKIVAKWVEFTLSTYGSSAFFSREKDKFANPVGGVLKESLDELFVLLSKGAEQQKCIPPLENIMAIRAVQEFSPSQAVAPLNGVKHITREVLAKDKERCHLIGELYDFEFAVDLALLAAFDIYMQYRERLYQVRINEIRSGNSRLTDSTCPSKLLNEQDENFLKVKGS